MTALLGLFAIDAASDDTLARQLLSGMVHGAEATLTLRRSAPDAAQGVASLAWDEPAERRLASDGRYTVVADASLYYLDSLRRKLSDAGVEPPAGTGSAADWILAATRSWGDEAVQRIEGEFAFAVWDQREQRLFAARDHTGLRPLFFARIRDGLALASSMRAIRRVPGCPDSLNLVAIVEDAANLDIPFPRETAYAAIERLPAGMALSWQRGGPPKVSRWWEVPIFEAGGGPPFEEAAKELRELIARAVLERTDLDRGTAVMLSGGYDSTAVYGAGQQLLQRVGESPQLRAVSLSHPPGDPGREDELILATTRRWGQEPRWVDSENVPALGDPIASAARRDEPLSHPYELWNRALADACRSEKTAVALNGLGGDSWFSASPIFLADLFRQGRLLELRREWRLWRRRPTWYGVFKSVIQPNLSPSTRTLIARLRRGRELHDGLDREIPEWVRGDFVSATDLRARRKERVPRRRGENLSAAEHAWFVQAAFPERINAILFSYCQESGVELRTPLLDSRVARFAAQRPRWESISRRQNKHLLRRSMHGVLPDELIAPRATRTGLPTSYFWRSVKAHLRFARDRFQLGTVLADIGVVDHNVLLSSLDAFLRGEIKDLEQVAALSFGVQAEWWLRSELGER